MKRAYLTRVAMVAGLLYGLAGFAAEPREITWDDLVPPEAVFDDVFTRLDEDQLYELTLVAEIRDRLAAGGEVDDKTMAAYRERVELLEEQEVDVDGLLAMREQVTEERIAKTFLANEQLDGQQVKMPGYLLPLEFDGELVTEFLLVPWVGACIHTPPPPPNQIVHVTAAQGFKTDGGLFTPVWVSGPIRTERGQSNLSLVDGSSDVTSSYSLQAESVEPYE